MTNYFNEKYKVDSRTIQIYHIEIATLRSAPFAMTILAGMTSCFIEGVSQR